MHKKIGTLLLALLLIAGSIFGAGAATTNNPVTKAEAQKFYQGYDLTVYDETKPAVLFGSYIVVGRYEVQVFYAADGYIIGVIDGDWPVVDAQIQLDNFNAYRGLPRSKLQMVDTRTMDESGIKQYQIRPEYATPKNIEEQRLEAVRLTNEERARNGKNALEIDDDLMAYAQMRAEELEIQFSHTRPDGARQKPFSGAVKGENIYQAGGYAGADRSISAWIKSPGHHRNMLKGSATRIGIGFYQDEDGNSYWVQLFAGKPGMVSTEEERRKGPKYG